MSSASPLRNRFAPRLEGLDPRTVPAVFAVSNLADAGAGSLRQAVLDANAAPGADVILVAPRVRGTVTLTSGELAVTDDLLLAGPGSGRLTVSGGGASRVFNVSGAATDVVIRGLTVAAGRATGPTADGPFGAVTAGGGLLNTGARVTLAGVAFANNQAVGPIAVGGAVANVFGGTLVITDGTFTGNVAAGTIRGAGGAVANEGGSTLVVDGGTFTGNRATTALGAGPGVQGNGLGGALVSAGGSRASISRAVFAGNEARGGDGADGGPGQAGGTAGAGIGGAVGNEGISFLVPFAPSTMTVTDSTFVGNRATAGTGGAGGAGASGGSGGGAGGLSSTGGAINSGSSSLTVVRTTFVGNVSTGGAGGAGGAGGNGGTGGTSAGGAISSTRTPTALTGGVLVRGALAVGGSLFQGNESVGGAGGAGGDGGTGGAGGAGQAGAVRLFATDWDIRGSVFVGNRAVAPAGGVAQGGAVFTVGGSVGTLSDSVLVLNEAAGDVSQGGGIFVGPPAPEGTPTLTVRGTVVAFNQAGEGGGLFLAPGGVAAADPLAVFFGNDVSGDLGEA